MRTGLPGSLDLSWVPIPYSVVRDGAELRQERWVVGTGSWLGESSMAVWRDVCEGDGLGAALTSDRRDSSSVGLQTKEKGQHRAWGR